MIFEDDALLDDRLEMHDLKPMLEKVCNLETWHELVGMYAIPVSGGEKPLLDRSLDDGYSVLRLRQRAHGLAVAYLIRRSGVEKILNRAMPIWCPIDALFGNTDITKVKCFVVKPWLFDHAHNAASLVGNRGMRNSPPFWSLCQAKPASLEEQRAQQYFYNLAERSRTVFNERRRRKFSRHAKSIISPDS